MVAGANCRGSSQPKSRSAQFGLAVWQIARYAVYVERSKALNWWTGRISDSELAEWTGLAPRAVGLILGLPALRGGVTGGGRGGRYTRRIAPKTRNAVAVIHALSESGLSFELSSNIATAAPAVLSAITQLVDYKPAFTGVRSLPMFDPAGNWRDDDVVPAFVWERHVWPCRSVEDPNPTLGKIFFIEADEYAPNTPNGTMVLPHRNGGTVEIIAMTDAPVYAGEHDPLGLLLGNTTEAVPRLDEHLLIVNGKWIIHKSPLPSPRDAMDAFMRGGSPAQEPLQFIEKPIAAIEDDRKTVRVIGWGKDEAAQEDANKALANYASVIDVNMTFAVRRMKRKALGVEK